MLGGRTLLERQLSSLDACGITDVTVVAGHKADRVARVCGSQASVVENPQFASTNSLYSLWLARARLTGGFVVMNGDVLFHPQLLADLLCDRHDAALLVEYRRRSPQAFADEEMKVKVRGGCLVDIRKTLRWTETDGENLGIAKFGPVSAPLLSQCLDDLVSAGCLREWAPRAFKHFAERRPLHVVGTRGLPWVEIDFPEDYERATREVLPLVDSPEAASRRATGTSAGHAAAHDANWRPESGHV